MEIRGLTVAVGDWYARTLAICLPQNMRHLSECLVITAPGEQAVKDIVERVPGARVFETDAFTRHGGAFNKGLAIEEGFDVLSREGWLLVWDSDCLFPDHLILSRLEPGKLHGCYRRILEDPRKWRPGFDWNLCPRVRDGAPVGYFQLFDAADPAIYSKRPWYDVTFAHAGGGDAYFLRHWKRSQQRMLPMDVLHLGPRDRHWFGTDDKGKDTMAAYVVRNGWTRRCPMVDRTAVDRVGEIVDRVTVPGYPPTEFELPFVQRSRAAKR